MSGGDGEMAREGYVTVEGGRVWYEIVGEGAGLPLILLHGGPGFSSLSFEPLRPMGRHRRVVFYDQLGSYRSDHPEDPSLWTLERFVRELHTLRLSLGLERCHILGHSWGTMLLAAYLREHRRGVASAIFSGPCLDARRWARDQEALRRGLPPDMQRAILEAEADPAKQQDPAYRRALDQFYRRHFCRLTPWPEIVRADLDRANLQVYETMWGPAEFTATGRLRDYNATPDLPDLDLPTLFTCGRHDEATPESTDFYRSLVPGAEFHVFEASAHMTYDEEPEEYVRVVGTFLDRHDGSE